MGQIKVEFDNTLEFSDIVMPLLSSSPMEAGENVKPNTDKMQTSVFGIQVPLISINSTLIDFDSIEYFSLSCTGPVPTLTMNVQDKYELMTNVDKPRQDNEVRIQILPRFDNAYKKINMTFYISSINVYGESVRLSCVYKVPKLISSRIEAMGELDTYSIFKKAATDTGLGFATNIAQGDDKRWVYCNNKSWLDLMNEEIEYSGRDNQMLDWWIDFWNNINLVDIYERYTTIDKDEDMMIWVAGQLNEMDIDNDVEPYKVVATLHNHPSQSGSELFVQDYEMKVNSGSQVSGGTDKIYSIYEDGLKEYKDYLIQDGDVKKDIFTKYHYLGENYGDYNYLLQREIRTGILQKINSESIKLTLNSPLLGVMRGHRVNFMKYVNDDLIEHKMQSLEEVGAINRDVKSNIPLEDYENDIGGFDGSYKLDKAASGQFLVTGVNIVYDDGWKYNITITRPACETPDVINEEQ